jgi:hypothetical protein
MKINKPLQAIVLHQNLSRRVRSSMKAQRQKKCVALLSDNVGHVITRKN